MQEREISIVVPCYNEAPALPHLYTELTALKQKLPGVSFEFVLVDDGSTDGTRDVIRDLSEKDADVRYVFFSRNFGKEAALLAGLEAARGNMSPSWTPISGSAISPSGDVFRGEIR